MMKRLVDEVFKQNTYVANIDNKVVIIDPGYNYEKIVRYIRSENLKPDLILLTHYHFDHVACVDLLAKDFDIKAYIHEKDFEHLTGDTLAERMGFARVSVRERNVETFKDSIDFLPSLKIHNMPGHSEGSCIFEFHDKYFTGDVIFPEAFGRIDMPGSSIEKMANTIKALRKFNKDWYIFPGHGHESLLGQSILYKKEQ